MKRGGNRSYRLYRARYSTWSERKGFPWESCVSWQVKAERGTRWEECAPLREETAPRTEVERMCSF